MKDFFIVEQYCSVYDLLVLWLGGLLVGGGGGLERDENNVNEFEKW